MNNILILDLDGIINVTVPNLKHEHVYLLDQKQEDLFIPQLAKNINKLCKEFDFKIVISSTWRKHYSLQELEYMLRYMGIESPIVGSTPISNKETRSVEITHWLDTYSDKWSNYYVLDDLEEAFNNKLQGYQANSDQGFDNKAFYEVSRDLRQLGFKQNINENLKIKLAFIDSLKEFEYLDNCLYEQILQNPFIQDQYNKILRDLENDL